MEIRPENIDDIVKEVIKSIERQEMNAKWTQQASVVTLQNQGVALKSNEVKEVGIGIAPAFDTQINHTINGLSLKQVIKELMAGIEEEGMSPRIIRVMRTSDVSFIGNDVAKLCGSGVAIGIQSKGTAVIHHKDLYPLTNLELFPQAPLLTLETYRTIGRNAAKYAKGEQVIPHEAMNDPMIRPKYQVKAALMHTIETECVVNKGEPIEIKVINN